MSITVGKLFGNGTVLYQMKLLAGQKGLNNLVEWVHIIENDEVSKFLHGKEVVFTSGMLNNNDGWLLEYAKKLYSAGTSAFVVNIGPYTKLIPDNVVKYCNSVNMPLYTIPWETRMVDVTRDICYRIMQREQVEISIAATIKNIIFKVGDLETQILQMERYGYLRDSHFCFIVISIDKETDENKEMDMNKVKVYAERIARSIQELYISFSYNECLVLGLVNYSDYNINNFVNTFFKSWNQSLGKINMGISENKVGIEKQAENFNNAFTAMKMAKKQYKQVIYYDKLDIYKILLNTRDSDLLKEYYNDALGKLEKYDKENNTNLMDFLDMYLKNNGSVQLVAEKQYIHRNTVNNQIKKIEKITNYNPLDLHEKVKFILSFYIRDIM